LPVVKVLLSDWEKERIAEEFAHFFDNFSKIPLSGAESLT